MSVYTIRRVTKNCYTFFLFFLFFRNTACIHFTFPCFFSQDVSFFQSAFLDIFYFFGNKKPGSRRAFLFISSTVINSILSSVFSFLLFFFPLFCFPISIFHFFFHDLLCLFEAIEHLFIEVLAEVIKCLQHSGFLDLEVDHLVGCKRQPQGAYFWCDVEINGRFGVADAVFQDAKSGRTLRGEQGFDDLDTV